METLKVKTDEQINAEILAKRTESYNKVKGARVGDFIKLPYGLFTRITHVWDDKLQTGGSANNPNYLGNGSQSYSGGLDSGVKPSDIRLTPEIKKGAIWFFSNDWAVAHNDVKFEIDQRVFELIEGADISGIQEIKDFEYKTAQEKLPKVEMYNGNNQLYSRPLPLITILSNINPVALGNFETQTGLTFVGGQGNHVAQPTSFEQITKLFLTANFSTKYYNNGYNKNVLMLTINND